MATVFMKMIPKGNSREVALEPFSSNRDTVSTTEEATVKGSFSKNNERIAHAVQRVTEQARRADAHATQNLYLEEPISEGDYRPAVDPAISTQNVRRLRRRA